MNNNILTIDTEDWFQVFYGSNVIAKDNWSNMESKIDRMVADTLELLASNNTVATFFVVGWIADKYPKLVRQISDEGHEIASHGYWHTEVFRQNRNEFKEDVTRAKICIEQACGKTISGYRAPGYSIRPTEEWALDILVEAGFGYDSSLLYMDKPLTEIRHGFYEVAPNAIKMPIMCLPSNGGFVFRVLPYNLYKRYVNFLNRKGVPLVFYTHTWEIFTDYPHISMPLYKRLVQYTNLKSVKNKVERLIHDYKFTSINKFYALD